MGESKIAPLSEKQAATLLFKIFLKKYRKFYESKKRGFLGNFFGVDGSKYHDQCLQEFFRQPGKERFQNIIVRANYNGLGDYWKFCSYLRNEL